jgi:hypothetical protein
LDRGEIEGDGLEAFRDLVRRALEDARLADGKLTLRGLQWRSADRLVIQLAYGEDVRFAVELFDQSAAYESLARGPRYGSATRKGPGLVDPGDEATDPRVREAAGALCHALSALQTGPSIGSVNVHEMTSPEPGLRGEPLVQAVAAALAQAPPRELGRWEGPQVGMMERWGPVAEVAYALGERTLVFIISPRDDTREAFRRSRDYELVYYSDDLPPEEHGELYERDAREIEAFAAWFQAWTAQGPASP